MNIQYKQKISEQVSAKDIVNMILSARGVEDRSTFLSPPSPLDMSLKDFGFKKKDIGILINKLSKVYESNGMVVVYTDYDADGITGGAVLWETLHLLGFNAMPYVPDRITEGYGFSQKGLDTIKKKFDPQLIISVDHGITAVEQITYAKKELGISVIVTDHHHKQKKIPKDAELLIHIPALSGSGVAYFVAKEIFQQLKIKPSESEGKNAKCKILKYNFKNDYAAIAAIGTVADLVPLVGPSRALVAYGLKAFAHMKRWGFIHLFQEAGIEKKSISPYEIGFIIAPRINAIGRLEHAIDALRLICTTRHDRALQLASKIGEANTKRRDLVRKSLEEADYIVAHMAPNGELPKLLILYADHWHEGVIGLIASGMVEKYYRPTIVMTRTDGHYKASVRSIGGFHITKFLEKLQTYLVHYGGHAAAAGFTLSQQKRDIFIKKAQSLASKIITQKDLERTIFADIKLPASLMRKTLYVALQSLYPFGIGNPRPTFVSDVVLVHAGTFGKQKTHLKLQVKQAKNDASPLEMIAFGKADLFTKLSKNQTVQIVYQLDLNKWNGRESLRGLVKHIEL